MIKLRNACLVAGALCSAMALAQNELQLTPTNTRNDQQGLITSKQLASLPIPSDEASFLERIHHINQGEIRMGTLAQQNATAVEVRDFAKMMVNDHRQADDQLVKFAASNNITLAEPKATNDEEKRMMNAHEAGMAKLQSLTGLRFDQAFMAAMVEGHDMAIDKVMAATIQYPNWKSNTLLTALLPKLEQHRDHAFRILGHVKAYSNTGTGGSGIEDKDGILPH